MSRHLTKVTVDDIKGRLDRKEAVFLLDVRTPETWEGSMTKLPGAVRIPPDEVSAHLNELPRDVPIVAYCASPHDEASTRVASSLVENGFERVHPLYGGFKGWTDAGYPVEPK